MSENIFKRTRMERVNEARRVVRENDPDGIYHDYNQCARCKYSDSAGNCNKAELYPFKDALPCYRHEKE